MNSFLSSSPIIKAFLLTALFSLMFTSSAFAGWDEGVAAFKAQDFQTAAKEFKAASVQNPDTWGNHYMLGLSLFRMGNREASLRSLTAAYDLNPNDLSLKSDLKRVLDRKGKMQTSALFYLYGTTAYSLGLDEECKRAFQKGRKIVDGDIIWKNLSGLPGRKYKL